MLALVFILALARLISAEGGFFGMCDIFGFESSNDQFNQLLIDVNCNGNCSRMNVGSCVANIGGTLTPWPNGQFSLQGGCRNCVLYNPRNASLECACPLNDGTNIWRYSQLDLNLFISNDYGALTCYGFTSVPTNCSV
ncbi:hypothetical protein GGR54DRAFT_620541 [Hypoxylon sp. NC1633]|nr:hypothetical protein GGR54DRAFT_620541 [Hypoxylon sp. NC1633]